MKNNLGAEHEQKTAERAKQHDTEEEDAGIRSAGKEN